MLESIEDCDAVLATLNEELFQLDTRLERLKLERDHVVAVRDLYAMRDALDTISEETSNQPIVMYPLYAEIIAIIRDNPGLNGVAVRENLVTDMEPRQLSYTLRAMREKGYIENRGGQGRSGSWYVKTIEEGE